MPTGSRSRRIASISTAIPFEVGTSTDDDARIVIQFAETLDGNHLPAADNFGYAVNFGATTTPSTVSLSGSAVPLAVSGIITDDDLHVEYEGGTLRVNYFRDLVANPVRGRLTAPAGNGVVPPSVTVSADDTTLAEGQDIGDGAATFEIPDLVTIPANSTSVAWQEHAQLAKLARQARRWQQRPHRSPPQ